jgi:PAS domain S-box-containing protein
VGAIMRDLDWSRSPLGAPENWSPTLRSTVNLILPSSAQIVVFWGPDFCALYNDAYAPAIGNNHPHAIGQPARIYWAELWHDIEPLFERARSGETIFAKDRPFLVERKGYPEEVFFDISYSPVRNDAGEVEGIFCVVAETTDRVLSQRELAAERERLSEMFRQAPSFIARLDGPDHTFTYANDAYRKLVGGRDVVGKSVVAALPEIAGQGFLDLLDRVYRSGEAFVGRGMPVKLEYEAGQALEDRFLDFIYQPMKNHEGQVTGIFVEGYDVTENHKAAQALAESEQRAREIGDNISQFAWIADASGSLTWYNRRWYEYTGTTFEEMQGWGWQKVHHPDHVERVTAKFAKHISEGVPWEDTFPLRGKDGNYCWFLSRALPIKNAEGEVVRWFGTNTDITAQIEAEQALRASESQFRSFAQAVPNHVWTSMPNGVLDWFNDRVYEYSGATQDDLAGGNWTKILHPDDVEETARQWRQAIETETLYEAEFRIRDANGQYRWHIARAVPIRSAEGGIVRWVGSNTDVHDQKDVEAELERRLEERSRELMVAEESLRQAQKMEALGQLTGGIAHDFNNLLTGIIGSLDILRRRISTGRTEDLGKFMDAATASANRAAGLTQRLLAFSRRQSLDLRPVDIDKLAASLSDLLRRTLGEQIELHIAGVRDLWMAEGDPNQIEIALLNFAINARDAMPHGGKLSITTRNRRIGAAEASANEGMSPGDYVAISVADTGTGMPPDVLRRAVDPFFTTKPIGQGTGLGLSMAYGYAKQARGHLQIESAPGAGTTVTLYLPRSRVTSQQEADTPQKPVPSGEGETVLVVEDDPSVRLTVVEVLRDLGYRAIEAVDGRSAIPILESRQRIDLMVSDVGLPGMNGRQIAEIARAMRPDLQVLFITGYAENARVRGGFLGPGMQMITKPFAVDALATKIRDMISES